MKSKLPIILIMALFAVLTVTYLRYAIWSPTDALLTRHLTSDLSGHFLHAWNSLKLLEQGIMPIGSYWIQYGGGYPAPLIDQLAAPQDFLLMIFYAVTDSFTLAYKFVNLTFYFTTLVMAYWLGKVLFKRRDMSMVLAVAYTFSMYGVNQLEHPELLHVSPFILLTLIFLEKALAKPDKPLYIILAGLGLFLVSLSQLYPLYFLLVFIGFRLVFQLSTTQHRLKALYTISKVGVLFLLTAVPFLLLQLNNMPSEQCVDTVIKPSLSWHSQPPSLYFTRNAAYTPYVPEIFTMYLGLSVLTLALIPTILKREARKLYLLHLLVTVVFFLYAIGQYAPVNLALWFREYVPLAFFIRVPGRALVIGYLSLSVCAAIGFGVLIDKAKQLRTPTLTTLAVVLIIFADLTIGFEPPTMTVPPTTEGAYQFVREQPEDFRIIEVPSLHGQPASTPIYTGHDTIGTIPWAHGHFEPLLTFRTVYFGYVNRNITTQEAALYGVKYIVVNTDPEYFDAHQVGIHFVTAPNLSRTRRVNIWLNNSEDHRLVYSEGHVNVYENLEFRGLVTSDGTNYLCWSRKDTNTLVIDYDSTTPTSITVSQSYSDGWVATLDGEEKLPVRNFNSVQQVDVPAGEHNVVLHYQHYESSLLTGLTFYIAALIAGAALWRRKALFILLAYGIGLAVFSLTLYPYADSLYYTALTGLSIALVIGSGSILFLGRKR